MRGVVERRRHPLSVREPPHEIREVLPVACSGLEYRGLLAGLGTEGVDLEDYRLLLWRYLCGEDLSLEAVGARGRLEVPWLPHRHLDRPALEQPDHALLSQAHLHPGPPP